MYSMCVHVHVHACRTNSEFLLTNDNQTVKTSKKNPTENKQKNE